MNQFRQREFCSRADGRMAAVVQRGIALKLTLGAAAARLYLQRFEVPGEVIERVMKNGRRRPFS